MFKVSPNQDQNQHNIRKYLNYTKIQELKAGQFFGQIEFFTGQPRIYSVQSTDFTSIIKIPRLLFIQMIKQFSQQKDYEKYCMLRDKLLNQKEYFVLDETKCFTCNRGNHTSDQCGYTHYTPPIKQVVKQNQNLFQQRQVYERHQRIKSNSKDMKYQFNEALYYFIIDQDNELEVYENNYLSDINNQNDEFHEFLDDYYDESHQDVGYGDSRTQLEYLEKIEENDPKKENSQTVSQSDMDNYNDICNSTSLVDNEDFISEDKINSFQNNTQKMSSSLRVVNKKLSNSSQNTQQKIYNQLTNSQKMINSPSHNNNQNSRRNSNLTQNTRQSATRRSSKQNLQQQQLQIQRRRSQEQTRRNSSQYKQALNIARRNSAIQEHYQQLQYLENQNQQIQNQQQYYIYNNQSHSLIPPVMSSMQMFNSNPFGSSKQLIEPSQTSNIMQYQQLMPQQVIPRQVKFNQPPQKSQFNLQPGVQSPLIYPKMSSKQQQNQQQQSKSSTVSILVTQHGAGQNSTFDQNSTFKRKNNQTFTNSSRLSSLTDYAQQTGNSQIMLSQLAPQIRQKSQTTGNHQRPDVQNISTQQSQNDSQKNYNNKYNNKKTLNSQTQGFSSMSMMNRQEFDQQTSSQQDLNQNYYTPIYNQQNKSSFYPNQNNLIQKSKTILSNYNLNSKNNNNNNNLLNILNILKNYAEQEQIDKNQEQDYQNQNYHELEDTLKIFDYYMILGNYDKVIKQINKKQLINQLDQPFQLQQTPLLTNQQNQKRQSRLQVFNQILKQKSLKLQSTITNSRKVSQASQLNSQRIEDINETDCIIKK